MAYAVGFLVVSVFFLALHYFTELQKNQKIMITAPILGVVILAIAFNTYSSSKDDKLMRVVLKYKQSKTVHCNGVEVNASNYTLSTGTYTFIGKKNTPNYAQMISASSCE